MQPYSANVTTSLSFWERPWASCRGQSTYRISPVNFTVLSDVFKDFNAWRKFFFCHTATLTNFLCYTLISQIQGKSAYLRFPASLWSLTPSSHHRIILALQASILRRPQGFCYWLLYDDTLQGIVDDVRLHRQNHFRRKESANPVSRINLSHYHRISAGLKNPSSLS